MGTKQSSKIAKQFFCGKISTRKRKRASLINKKCLGGYFDLHLRLIENFFFGKRKFQKITRVNFVGPDTKFLNYSQNDANIEHLN